jgi:glycosyltransferase involved in cell wall biosynthesis
VGDGPGRRAAEAQARPLAGPVRFTGFAPHARIPAVLRHIDLLVLATRYEELPSVLIEAMAAGLPVIASRVGGIPALVDHDVNGLLVPPATRPPSPRPSPASWPSRAPPPGWPLPPGRPRSGTPGPG